MASHTMITKANLREHPIRERKERKLSKSRHSF